MKALTIISGVVFLHISAFVILVNGCSTRASRERARQQEAAAVQPPSDSVPAGFTPAPVESEPVPATEAPAPAPAQPVESTSAPAGETQTYIVKKNDSLTVIAKKFHVSIDAICELNGITRNQVLRENKKLLIPPEGTGLKEKPAPVEGEIYIVQKGDALSLIARNKGTTVSKIKEANNLTTDNIRIGQKLIIPSKDAPAPQPQEQKTEEPPAEEPAPAAAPEEGTPVPSDDAAATATPPPAE